MDKHLNLFYSYELGDMKDKDRAKQLENNITRAFIVTLMNLTFNMQKSIIESILDKKNINKKHNYFKYDLQNLKDRECLSKIDNNSRFLLTITSTKYIVEPKLGIKLRETYSGKQSFDNIADAWIYNNHFVILCESKIGNNKINESQLIGHLINRKYGLGIPLKELKEIPIICLTWNEIYGFFNKLNIREMSEVDKRIVEKYKEYMIMTGNILDLSFVVSEDGYNREIAREQFPLLLAELDKKVKIMKLGLERDKRALSDHLWDFYGKLDENNRVKKNPHYSIFFDTDGAGIGLTITQKKSKIRELLKSDEIKEILINLCKLNDISIERYFLGLKMDGLIDYKKGQRKGETHETFNFTICLKKINSTNINNEIESILKDMHKNVKYAKSFDLSLKIEYPNICKIKDSDRNTLRMANRELFIDYNNMISKYLDFLEATQPLFNLLCD